MAVDLIRSICLSLPLATEHVQWGNDLVFKVAGKMFAVTCLEPSAVYVSFKATPEEFAELTERPGIIPAPYLARAHWVALQEESALPLAELEARIARSHALVVATLSKKIRRTLGLAELVEAPGGDLA